MAKWDERDPRWLVQHRDDGKNVNGWHWEEKNKLEWSKQRISELVTALPAAEAGGLCITCLKELTGEAMITTRKANKKLVIYDLKITLDWKAKDEQADKEVKGQILIEEYSSHSDPEDVVFTVTAEGSGPEQDNFKAVASSLQPHIMGQLAVYVQELQQQ
eukprot:jgi/Chrzof1/8426/Cz03g10080.t1